MGLCTNCNKEKSLRTKNFCHSCYQGLRKDGVNYKKKLFKKDLIGTKCQVCEKIRLKSNDIEKDLCASCYQKKRYNDNPDLHVKHKKLCRDYRRKQRGVDTELPLLCAPAGSGSIKKGQGYKVICKKEFRGMPHADKKGRIAEHTYVMMQHLGRPLFPKETVHHKNGIRDDNRIENLELRSSHHGPGQRIEDKIEWCKEFLKIYGYCVIKIPDSV